AGKVIYMRTNSPTTLAIHNKQLANHSTSIHSDGFGTPIGLLTEKIALENCTDEQLQSLGITIGNIAEFTVASGIHVKGKVTVIIKNDKIIALLSFNDCTVTYNARVLFD
ncbi:aromatic amino acid hydroxylase, partial [Bacillus sp. 'calajunan']